MSGPQLLDVPGLYPGVPYAYAATQPPGTRLVLTAGACPLDAQGRVVAPGDVAAQAAVVMDHLESALRAAGAGLGDVLKSTVYVASSHRQDLVAAWEVVQARMGPHRAPQHPAGGHRARLARPARRGRGDGCRPPRPARLSAAATARAA